MYGLIIVSMINASMLLGKTGLPWYFQMTAPDVSWNSMSNGGGFVGTLACSPVGGEFAAFAPASGSFYTDNSGVNDGCTPARSPLPILEIHGGADGSVHYDGGVGEGGIEPSIPTWYILCLLML